ncbi:MAG: hypothetical protein LAP40_02780 [Acidobacteriia bacterium]|nr:hypothetical protein [Terriglobia bacterium]
MRTRLLVLMTGVGLLMPAVPVWAHHAFAAEFDASRPVKLRGTVTKWELVNPHSWIHMDVKGDDGTVTSWMVEVGSPNSLFRLGFTKNSLPAGTEILVDGYQAKDRGNLAVGKNLTFPDGKRLFLGGSASELKDGSAGAEKK